jgi:two-component system, chemotaxis family, sensor kinase CheA
MSKIDLREKVEALASEVMTSDPHDLQAVNRIIQLFGEIADGTDEESTELIKSVAGAAISLAEEMIVQQGEESSKSLDTLGRTVSAIQTVLRDSLQAGVELIPQELGVNLTVESSLSPQVDKKIFTDFLSSQESVLQEMESHILAIEKKGLAGKGISNLKRILHTLKGEAGLLSLKDVEHLCHETESYLEQPPDGNLADYLLSVKDWLAQRLAFASGKAKKPKDVEDLLKALNSDSIETIQDTEQVPETNSDSDANKTDGEERVISLEGSDVSLVQDFITESRGHLDNADVQLLTIESTPEDPEALNAVFRSFHTIKGVAGFLDLHEISELSHVAEDLLDKARKGTVFLSGSAIDAIFETVDTLRKLVSQVEEALTSGESVEVDPAMFSLMNRLKGLSEGKVAEESAPEVEPEKKLGEILVESGQVKADVVAEALSQKGQGAKLGEILIKKGNVPVKEVATALRAQQVARKNRESVQVKETLKIDTERLDKLLDAIGELVIAESIVSQDEEVLSSVSTRVARNMSHLNKITRVVQELGMSMRMVPIRPTFQKVARLVRDLAKKADKKIDFVTSGEETELDRSVVEKIGDPLVHLIRNSVDHGIESDETERINAGKSAVSRVELRAFHQGGSIYIEVSDDGRGLDREAILAKARERGIVEDGSQMSDREVFNLIFAPGFSTAKKVTDVSGRGVGMDVVKRNIESLRGNIELTSELGKGTTVSMRLPLTLAIIDGMIIEVGPERYIVPTLSVVESLRPKSEDLSKVQGRGDILSIRGQLMPMYHISRIFNIPGAIDNPTESLVIIVEDQERRVALLVDSLIGQHQVVIKNLGEGLGKVQGISGGAIMPDGQVGLILDISELVKLAHSNVYDTTSKPKVVEEESQADYSESEIAACV